MARVEDQIFAVSAVALRWISLFCSFAAGAVAGGAAAEGFASAGAAAASAGLLVSIVDSDQNLFGNVIARIRPDDVAVFGRQVDQKVGSPFR